MKLEDKIIDREYLDMIDVIDHYESILQEIVDEDKYYAEIEIDEEFENEI